MRPRARDVAFRLPLRHNPGMRTHARIIIAHHLVMTLYGHWLSNDPRGSGSAEIRKDELKDLGPVLPGRQFPQPSKNEIKD